MSNPRQVIVEAASVLARISGYTDAVIACPVADLVAVLHLGIFEQHAAPQTYRETLTFLDGGRAPTWPLPWTNPKSDGDILHVHDDTALSLIRKPRNTAGNPTWEVERETGGTATLDSITRLAKAAQQGL